METEREIKTRIVAKLRASARETYSSTTMRDKLAQAQAEMNTIKGVKPEENQS